MGTLPERVAATIAAHGMVSHGQMVLVALSGGPDSTALLHALAELQPQLQCRLCACHVHHGLRGRDADADAECAAAQAEAHRILFMLERADVRAYARGRKLSLETAGREVRYDLLGQAAAALGADRIATGHTADDLAETVVMNILRGSGPGGLAGIPPVRGPLIRPLLEVSRAEVQGYCAAEGLAFRVDRSNEDRDFFRNRIRHEVVPLLQKLQPRAAEALARLAQVMRDEEAYMDVEAAAALAAVGSSGPRAGEQEVDLAAFRELHPALQRRVARLALASVKGNDLDLTLERINAVVDLAVGGRTGAAVELPGGLRAERRYGRLVVRRESRAAPRTAVERLLPVPGEVALEEMGVTLTAKRSRARRPPSDPNVALLDAARIGGHLVVRTWRRGDRFTPLGMRGSVKLQDFFVNEKVPRAERSRVPLVVCGGAIAWVVGRRIGDDFKVTAQTQRAIRLEASRLAASRTPGGEG